MGKILISHRGNTVGKLELYENEPSYIHKTLLEGFDVEVDIWYIENNWYLGHDNPQYKIDYNWLKERKDKLWIHCKNIEAMEECNKKIELHYFWHQEDIMTLTSNNFLWVHFLHQPIENSIAVLPELSNKDISKCIGICSDFIKKYI